MSTITAGKAAAEFRKLADALDASPDEIIEQPFVYFCCFTKATFLAVAKVLPRPLSKRVEEGEAKWRRFWIEYRHEAIHVDASVPQHLTCELVEPAKPAVYRCDPILSMFEEDEVTR